MKRPWPSVGGHTFGKCHGAAPAGDIGPEPEGCPVEAMGFGWAHSFGTGVGSDVWTSGIEGAWTDNPTGWDNGYLANLFSYDWELMASPAGLHQWTPTNPEARDTVPDAHDTATRHAPMMLTTDLSLKVDPIYEPIARRFLENPDELAEAFAKAWYKLLHRDMGPLARYLGPWVPEPQLWQDPIPAVDHDLVSEADVAALTRSILDSGLTIPQLVIAAWASASTFRGTDKRGGANGGRLRLAPQRDWEVNAPPSLALTLSALEAIQEEFNGSQSGATRISLADLVVLGGGVAIEQAARHAGLEISVPFSPGRTDASQEQTDVESFAVLEPRTDGFRNHLRTGEQLAADALLVERANLLTLTPREMTVLVGGMRALNANTDGSSVGVLTNRPETLTNDFFVHLLDMRTRWVASPTAENVYEGRDRVTVELRWTASAADLMFGSHSELRPLAEIYAFDGSFGRFAHDFVAAWTKVMNLDRFDLVRPLTNRVAREDVGKVCGERSALK